VEEDTLQREMSEALRELGVGFLICSRGEGIVWELFGDTDASGGLVIISHTNNTFIDLGLLIEIMTL
jgi:hypothetical protein